MFEFVKYYNVLDVIEILSKWMMCIGVVMLVDV